MRGIPRFYLHGVAIHANRHRDGVLDVHQLQSQRSERLSDLLAALIEPRSLSGEFSSAIEGENEVDVVETGDISEDEIGQRLADGQSNHILNRVERFEGLLAHRKGDSGGARSVVLCDHRDVGDGEKERSARLDEREMEIETGCEAMRPVMERSNLLTKKLLLPTESR